MNQPLLDALNVGARAMREYQHNNPGNSRFSQERAFRAGVRAFFAALPDGVARDLLLRKLPFHNWQAAFANEILTLEDADVPAGS